MSVLGSLRERTDQPLGLIASEGRFYSISKPVALDHDGEFKPPEMPAVMPPRLPAASANRPAPNAEHAGTVVHLTIDAEDDYFETPHLLTGEGIGAEFGTYGILEVLDRHGVSATFFVNVYEAHRHRDASIVERLVKTIAEHGHEVALHSHPSQDLDFYSRPLFWFSADDQKRILSYGADLIEAWTGSYPVSFRAGGYALSDATFEALDSLGIRIDSSCFFTSENNQITQFTVNAVRHCGGVTEVPVMCVARATPDGVLDHRKFDLNWLTTGELDLVIDRAIELGVGHVMFMMHSFSFIKKESFHAEQPGRSGDALFRSPLNRDRYVEIYGADAAVRSKFEEFVERLAADSAVEVKTLAAAANDLNQRARAPRPDIVPVV